MTLTVTTPKKPEGPMPKPTHPDYQASGKTNWAFWFREEVSIPTNNSKD